MKTRKRIYEAVLKKHIDGCRQMAFVSGPRQVGKTTTCRQQSGALYLDWDNDDHRVEILKGPANIADLAGLHKLSDSRPIIVFDEIHKYRRWKGFLKGFFDTYENECRIIVTGSSRLDVYRKGGDSLMGRYFVYRMHPLSVAELVYQQPGRSIIRKPGITLDKDWKALLEYGGFPEPFVQHDHRFSTKWRALRQTQVLREDVRDLTRIQELDQLEMLGITLADRSGQQIIYSNLARDIRTSENTIRSWISTLCSLHYGFLVRPWFTNITKGLRKEPKWYLRDWSFISDPGRRAETMCACHLLKAVEAWTDWGLGRFELRYIRDKQKREVDFAVVRDGKPWFIVEVKESDSSLSPSLEYFQKQTGCEHALQVVMNADFVDESGFARKKPVVVPARTFLSQLV